MNGNVSSSSASGSASIRLVETSPSEILLHRIEDHQLVSLTNISRPITLAIAGAAAGAFFSFLPLAISAFERLGTDSFQKGDMFNCIVMAVSFVILIVAGFAAGRGEWEARKILKDIRARNRTSI